MSIGEVDGEGVTLHIAEFIASVTHLEKSSLFACILRVIGNRCDEPAARLQRQHDQHSVEICEYNNQHRQNVVAMGPQAKKGAYKRKKKGEKGKGECFGKAASRYC